MIVVLQLGISYQLATSIYVIKYCTIVGSCFIMLLHNYITSLQVWCGYIVIKSDYHQGIEQKILIKANSTWVHNNQPVFAWLVRVDFTDSSSMDLQLGISYQLATSIYVIKYCTIVGSCFIMLLHNYITSLQVWCGYIVIKSDYHQGIEQKILIKANSTWVHNNQPVFAWLVRVDFTDSSSMDMKGLLFMIPALCWHIQILWIPKWSTQDTISCCLYTHVNMQQSVCLTTCVFLSDIHRTMEVAQHLKPPCKHWT